MILTYWGPTFKKRANQFFFDFQQGRSGAYETPLHTPVLNYMKCTS